MSNLVLKEAMVFCQYCRRPNPDGDHEECSKLVEQWQLDNFNMSKFWFGFIWDEALEFGNVLDLRIFYGFLPYILTVNKDVQTIKFIITDQEEHTTSYLHRRYCLSGGAGEPMNGNVGYEVITSHHTSHFMCYLEAKFKEVKNNDRNI